MDDKKLQTIWQQRQSYDRSSRLDESLSLLMKHTLGKRVRQLSQLASIWDEVIPDEIASHTALESYSQGVLTVMVDSAPHRFQLQTLLRGGLTRAIRERSTGLLRKIRLVPGQFATVDLNGSTRYDF